MEGYKKYRHEDNPLEKVLHDEFVEQFDDDIRLEQIVLPMSMQKKGLSEHEKNLIASTIQWLGSPVGQMFMSDCGFEVTDKMKRTLENSQKKEEENEQENI